MVIYQKIYLEEYICTKNNTAQLYSIIGGSRGGAPGARPPICLAS